MTKLRTLIRNGFDVVELLHKLVDEIDQIRDELAALRQVRCPEPVEGQERQAASKPAKQPPAAQTQE